MFLTVSNRKEVNNASYFKNPEELENFLKLFPQYDSVLFAFWSWIVKPWFLQTYKCYGMHTGFLLDGKGRGGSPIDNLQLLGIKHAALNVFEMNEVIDGGRVRLAIPIRINTTKEFVIREIDSYLPEIVSFLKEDISQVPTWFNRIKNK